MSKLTLYFVFCIASILFVDFFVFGVSENQIKKYKSDNTTYLSKNYSRPGFLYPEFGKFWTALGEKNEKKKYDILSSIHTRSPKWKEFIEAQKSISLLRQDRYREFYHREKGIDANRFKKYFPEELLNYIKKNRELSLKDYFRMEKNFPLLVESNEFLNQKLSFYRYGGLSYRKTLKEMWLNGSYSKYLSDKAKKKILISVQINASAEDWQKFLRRQFYLKNYRTVTSMGKKAIDLFNKKKEKPAGIYLIYLRALERRYKSTKILRVLENAKNATIFKTQGHALRRIKLQAYLRLRHYSSAKKYITALKKNKISKKTLNTMRLMVAERYFFYEQNYQNAKKFYSEVDLSLMTPLQAEKLQWEKYLLYHILKQRNQLQTVYKWAKNRDFVSSIYGSSFCYWTLKNAKIHALDLPKLNPCLKKYPNSYYGYKSLAIISRHETTSLKNLKIDFNLSALTKAELENLELLNFLHKVHETSTAKHLFQELVSQESNEQFLIAAIQLNEKIEDYFTIQRVLINNFDRSWDDEKLRQKIAFRFYYPQAYRRSVKASASKYNLPPTILYAIMREESHFNSKIASPAGAIGLMQLMPGTAKEIAKKKRQKYSFQNLLDSDKNLDFGAYYFKGLMHRFDNSPELSLAAYNGGPSNVKKWIKKYGTDDMDLFVELIPFKETRNYVKKVLRSYMIYNFIY